MRPTLDYDKLIEIVEIYENNQASKILQIKELNDIQLLKDFLMIDEAIFTDEQLKRIGDMSNYIDRQSQLYQQFKDKFDLEKQIRFIMKGITDLLLQGNIEEDIVKNLTQDVNFTDVIAEALVGQFPNTILSQGPRFNTTDFSKKIQKGGKAELEQIIRRVFWAAAKKKDTKNQLDIDIDPVGPTGRGEDIVLTFTMKGPRGGEKRTTLREDVKTRLEGSYLRSGSLPQQLATIIQKHIKRAEHVGNELKLKIDTKELYDVVADLLSKKYGAVYNNGKWNVNSAVFFTSPDGSIELVSEVLRSKQFYIILDDQITQYAIKRGFL